MEIKCCYRLIPHGEVIHSVYDSDVCVIRGMPDYWYEAVNLGLPEYSIRSYDNCNFEFDKMCETVLLSNERFALVVENNNIGYYIVQFDGTKRFLKSSIDTTESVSETLAPGQEWFKSVGFRRTKQLQVRSSNGVYRLVMGKRDKLFYTNDGVLKPGFDTEMLDAVDYHYKGYKDMIALNHYAVVYMGGEPVYLDKTFDGILKIAE